MEAPAASWPLGPTACCCCQTVGQGSAPHPGRLCPRSAVRQWLPGGTCSSVRCHPSATTPPPAGLEERAIRYLREAQGCFSQGFPPWSQGISRNNLLGSSLTKVVAPKTEATKAGVRPEKADPHVSVRNLYSCNFMVLPLGQITSDRSLTIFFFLSILL